MFEGLGQIDWTSFGKHIGVGQDASEIPDHIRKMLDPDEDVRADAFYFLFGEQQHTGMLVDATPYIIPFALEALRLEIYPDKDFILGFLSDIAYHVTLANNIPRMRFALKIYDILEKEMPLFLKLLHDPDENIREQTVMLLQFMQADAVMILDHLKQRFDQETKLSIRIEIIRSMTTLIKDVLSSYHPEAKPYIDLFLLLKANSEHPKEQEWAAIALEKINYLPW